MALNLQEVGQRILTRREKFGYTQEELAWQVGISRNSLSSLECGKKEHRIGILYALKKTLYVSADWILEGVPEPITPIQEVISVVKNLPLEAQTAVATKIWPQLMKIISDISEEIV